MALCVNDTKWVGACSMLIMVAWEPGLSFIWIFFRLLQLPMLEVFQSKVRVCVCVCALTEVYTCNGAAFPFSGIFVIRVHTLWALGHRQSGLSAGRPDTSQQTVQVCSCAKQLEMIEFKIESAWPTSSCIKNICTVLRVKLSFSPLY